MKPRTAPPIDPLAASRRALQEVLTELRQEVERPPDPFADLPARERAIIGRLPIPGRLAAPDRQGRRWVVGCQAWRLPVKDPLATDVVAGVLAGGRRTERADGTWLALPPTESVTGLLDYWGFSRTEEDGRLLVSPFFGALLAARMPVACASWMMTVRRAGDCLLLALCCWELVWGAGGPPHFMLPDHAGALPFICLRPNRLPQQVAWESRRAPVADVQAAHPSGGAGGRWRARRPAWLSASCSRRSAWSGRPRADPAEGL